MLPENKTLTLSKGIAVIDGQTLTIDGDGSLVATTEANTANAAIGGTAEEGKYSSGNVIIKGGNITATGGNAGGAGIGGAYEGDGGNITIAGGTVIAAGGSGGMYGGAGIGGGSL